jgi:hypothetical protein
MALLKPQALPQRFAVLYAACVEKAESQMTVKRASTTSMACGSAILRVRGNRGAIIR